MNLNYFTIDIESLGLKCGYHEITEVSIINNTDRRQLSKFIWPEHPERVSQEALDVTGRTRADLLKGIPKKEAVEMFDKFINQDGLTPEHRVMIGHNVSFDRRFVHHLWGSLGKVFPANLWLDTKTLAKEYLTKQLGIIKPKLTLHASLEQCGIKPKLAAHNAINDTQSTYILHNHLIKNNIDYLPFIKRHLHEEANDSE